MFIYINNWYIYKIFLSLSYYFRLRMVNSTENNDNLTSFSNYLKLLGINVLTQNETIKVPIRMRAYKIFMIFVVLLSSAMVFTVIYQIPFTVYTISQAIQLVSIQLMYFTILKSSSHLSIVKEFINALPVFRK